MVVKRNQCVPLCDKIKHILFPTRIAMFPNKVITGPLIETKPYSGANDAPSKAWSCPVPKAKIELPPYRPNRQT